MPSPLNFQSNQNVTRVLNQLALSLLNGRGV
jgi:hypothetical protein